MRCARCGTRYDADARFCTADGTLLTATPPSGVDEQGAGAAVAARRVAPAERPRAVPGTRGCAGRAGAPGASEPASTTLPASDALAPGMVLDGRYHVERLLGEGGMSVVYLARDVASRDLVAVKALAAALSADRQAMARLRREAELASRLVHPNICHILRLGEMPDGRPYVVMPYVDGELLADRIFRAGQLPLHEAVALVRDIAAGLHAAHRLGIVHRDLKPENVIVTTARGGGVRAVVMDFGLAKERRVAPEVQRITATGVVLGTPEFMSPEQLRGRPVDARTDVYALALMTCEMLTGLLPFRGQTQQDIMLARLREEPIPLARLRPELALPAPLERVVRGGLARDPAARYPTAVAFATALAAAAGGGRGSMSGALRRIFRW